MNQAEERISVINQLRSLHSQAEILMDSVYTKTAWTREEKVSVQLLYRSLKERLHAEHKAAASARMGARMSHFERAYYYPAVHKALCELRAPTNSHPSTWHGQLYWARLQLNWMLDQLESSAD